MSKVVVLLSGGIDSTTCLAMALDKRSCEEVVCLSLYYGQKHKKELESARNVAKHYGVKLYEQDISNVMQFSNCSLLTKSNKPIEHTSYNEQLSKKDTLDTYVPYRNGILISIAAGIALSLGFDEVWYGAHSDDYAGSAYPDCSPNFVKSLRDSILLGTANKITLRAPLVFFNKSEVVLTGMELGAPYDLTWSCYEGGDTPCGKCGTCIDRINAFKSNGLKDPIM